MHPTAPIPSFPTTNVSPVIVAGPLTGEQRCPLLSGVYARAEAKA